MRRPCKPCGRLLCDYFFWNKRHDHCYATANVPPGHTLVGNIAPLVDVEVNSYSSGWNVGDSVVRQRRWERIDPVRRQQFKAASREHEVTLGGQAFRQDATNINDSVLQALGDLSELEQLPCLMSHRDRPRHAGIDGVYPGQSLHQ